VRSGKDNVAEAYLRGYEEAILDLQEHLDILESMKMEDEDIKLIRAVEKAGARLNQAVLDAQEGGLRVVASVWSDEIGEDLRIAPAEVHYEVIAFYTEDELRMMSPEERSRIGEN
jgi:hypothetical protein